MNMPQIQLYCQLCKFSGDSQSFWQYQTKIVCEACSKKVYQVCSKITEFGKDRQIESCPRCLEKTVEIWCKECGNKPFCKECFECLHKKGKFNSHHSKIPASSSYLILASKKIDNTKPSLIQGAQEKLKNRSNCHQQASEKKSLQRKLNQLRQIISFEKKATENVLTQCSQHWDQTIQSAENHFAILISKAKEKASDFVQSLTLKKTKQLAPYQEKNRKIQDLRRQGQNIASLMSGEIRISSQIIAEKLKEFIYSSIHKQSAFRAKYQPSYIYTTHDLDEVIQSLQSISLKKSIIKEKSLDKKMLKVSGTFCQQSRYNKEKDFSSNLISKRPPDHSSILTKKKHGSSSSNLLSEIYNIENPLRKTKTTLNPESALKKIKSEKHLNMNSPGKYLFKRASHQGTAEKVNKTNYRFTNFRAEES